MVQELRGGRVSRSAPARCSANRQAAYHAASLQRAVGFVFSFLFSRVEACLTAGFNVAVSLNSTGGGKSSAVLSVFLFSARLVLQPFAGRIAQMSKQKSFSRAGSYCPFIRKGQYPHEEPGSYLLEGPVLEGETGLWSLGRSTPERSKQTRREAYVHKSIPGILCVRVVSMKLRKCSNTRLASQQSLPVSISRLQSVGKTASAAPSPVLMLERRVAALRGRPSSSPPRRFQRTTPPFLVKHPPRPQQDVVSRKPSLRRAAISCHHRLLSARPRVIYELGAWSAAPPGG